MVTRWAAELDGHAPADADEAAHLAAVRALVAQTPAPASREQEEPGHLTASGFLLSPDLTRVALIHHLHLGRWLQPGGHVEAGDAHLLGAAAREVREETGVGGVSWLALPQRVLDVDVHEIPARPSRGEGAHRHFDVRFAFVGWDEDLAAGEEVGGARWVSLDAVDATISDESVCRAVRRLRAGVRELAATAPGSSPAALRNREPIAEVLRSIVAPGARVLEVAAGTGEHAVFLAGALGVASWMPTEAAADRLALLWAGTRGAPPEVRPPSFLDVHGPWLLSETPDVLFVANLLHISPWSATTSLFRGAAEVLPRGGKVVVYGPFHEGGAATGPGNAAFDASLRARDPSWGVRDVEAVAAEAASFGLSWTARHAMPADNRVLVFERS